MGQSVFSVGVGQQSSMLFSVGQQQEGFGADIIFKHRAWLHADPVVPRVTTLITKMKKPFLTI
jgi:hypothetical protein